MGNHYLRSPLLSIREAVLTASPNKQNLGLMLPNTRVESQTKIFE